MDGRLKETGRASSATGYTLRSSRRRCKPVVCFAAREVFVWCHPGGGGCSVADVVTVIATALGAVVVFVFTQSFLKLVLEPIASCSRLRDGRGSRVSAPG